MNDYWNDPPEEPEMPECCAEPMAFNSVGGFFCEACGKKIEAKKQEQPEPADVELPDNYLRNT